MLNKRYCLASVHITNPRVVDQELTIGMLGFCLVNCLNANLTDILIG